MGGQRCARCSIPRAKISPPEARTNTRRPKRGTRAGRRARARRRRRRRGGARRARRPVAGAATIRSWRRQTSSTESRRPWVRIGLGRPEHRDHDDVRRELSLADGDIGRVRTAGAAQRVNGAVDVDAGLRGLDPVRLEADGEAIAVFGGYAEIHVREVRDRALSGSCQPAFRYCRACRACRCRRLSMGRESRRPSATRGNLPTSWSSRWPEGCRLGRFREGRPTTIPRGRDNEQKRRGQPKIEFWPSGRRTASIPRKAAHGRTARWRA